MLCAVYTAKCSSDIGKACSADGWGESNSLPPGIRNANYYVPWAKSLLDIQLPFLLEQKCLLENIMKSSPCKFLEDIFTVKIKKRKVKSLLSPNVRWRHNRPFWQPNADHTKDSCWVELGLGRVRGKRLQLLSSKQNQFSGVAAKDISVSSWHRHLRPVKDVVGGLPDEYLALLFSLFAVWLNWRWSIAAKEPERGQKKLLAVQGKNHSMKPETFHHEGKPESSGPSRAVQTGNAPLVLIQGPCLQLPHFQQQHDRKPREERDKRRQCLP